MTIAARIHLCRSHFPPNAIVFCEDKDAHGSEMPHPRFCLRSWLSGFSGSQGSLLITQRRALLWTDGRYITSAQALLEKSPVTVLPEETSLSPLEWIKQHSPQEEEIYVYAPTSLELCTWNKDLAPRKIIPFSDIPLPLWPQRPALSLNPVRLFSSSDTHSSARLAQIQNELEDSEQMLITDLCDIAWILQLRSSDIPYTPVFLSYLLLSAVSGTLFLSSPSRVTEEARTHLHKLGLSIQAYENIEGVLKNITDTLRYDPSNTQASLLISCRHTRAQQPLFSTHFKSIKTKEEIAGMHHAHLLDGLAIVHFLHWLTSQDSLPNERGAAEKLQEFRMESEEYLSESFHTIAAVGAHAAMPHYHASKETNKALSDKEVFLIDSGAHYLSGTSDVTRTLWLDVPSDRERRAYTLVLKSHIALASLQFPHKTSGRALDAIARVPLWNAGYDFNHGTGHGVGFVTNVHESPPNIGHTSAASLQGLIPGMIVSIEPGLYIEGAFGIRIENLYVLRKKTEEFIGFEPLTLAPITTAPIINAMLTDEEVAWINTYHALVYERLHSDLSPKLREWLKTHTASL